MSAWNQLEQLLTCAICLDRYRNPKLLPCHHTYCQEPCLEGLVDYARRQIKCPECRAEHRIPYQGVQTFPTNVTLCRFLELHRGITGEEPEPVPSMMERCGVCSEKANVDKCAHCDKKICSDCKEAHLDILRRELTRINSQVRRALGRLQEHVGQAEKNNEKLISNRNHIKDEVEEIVRRFVKDIKDKESKILDELEDYTNQEVRKLTKQQDDFSVEATNIDSNCELIEKHVLDQQQPWTDVELVEYKDIFLKTLEFLRSTDAIDNSDYTRKVRFVVNSELDLTRKNVIHFGELKLPQAEKEETASPCRESGSTLNLPPGNALSKSQSDHRLAAQFAKERGRYLDISASSQRLACLSDSETRSGRDTRASSPGFSRRPKASDRFGRFGQEEEQRSRYAREDPYRKNWPRPDDDSSSSFRSRFMRDRNADTEDEGDNGSSHGRSVRFEEPQAEREVVKVFDTKDAPRGPLSGVVKLIDTPHMMSRIYQNDVKMKKEKEQKEEEARMLTMSSAPTPVSHPPPSSYSTSRSRTAPSRQVSEDEIDKQKQANKAASSSASGPNSTALSSPATNVTPTASSRTSVAGSAPSTRRSSLVTPQSSVAVREASDDDEEDEDDEEEEESEEESEQSSTAAATTTTTAGRTYGQSSPPYSSTVGRSGNGGTPVITSRSNSITSTDLNLSSTVRRSSVTGTDSNSLSLASPVRRSSGYQYRTRNREEPIVQTIEREEPIIEQPTVTSPSSRTAVTADTGGDETGTFSWSSYLRQKYGSNRTMSGNQQPETPTRVNRSKSSHAIFNRPPSESSDDEERPASAVSPRRGSRDSNSSYSFGLPRSMYLQKRRMTLKIGTRGTEVSQFTWPRGVAVGPDNCIAVADSSNHRVQVFDQTGRFMFEFGSYGGAEGEFDCLAGVAVNRIGQFIVSDRYNHRIQIFDPSGKFLRSFGSEGRANGKFSYPWGITTDSLGFIYVCDKENHRIQVFQSDGTFVGKFGSLGSRPGQLEHPHYVAVSNTNRVIVSDSNNNRIQIFDVNGRSLSCFGSEGSEDGQFKFPRGVAVDDQGYIIVGDSGNNRIQIFNPDGSFLKSFGAWGSGDGEFKGLEGVAVSSTGKILVCDRENHRIQVF
ncbi:RING finger protein nhl-1 [Halotydeus destructor]|nr:RING finger protein nhl-1 [Halotydeus destructor]